MDREVKLIRCIDQCIVPLAHLLPAPARNSALVDGFCLVGYHQVWVNANHITITATSGTSTKRIVEVKQMLCRLYKRNAICFKTLGERFDIKFTTIYRRSRLIA